MRINFKRLQEAGYHVVATKDGVEIRAEHPMNQATWADVRRAAAESSGLSETDPLLDVPLASFFDTCEKVGLFKFFE